MYIVKFTIDKIGENMETKRAKSQVLVDTPLIAEAVSMVEVEYKDENLDINCVTKTACQADIVGEREKYYLVRYELMAIDEVSAKEKKITMGVYLDADDIDDAKVRFSDFSRGSICDIVIVSIKETKIEQYLYSTLA